MRFDKEKAYFVHNYRQRKRGLKASAFVSICAAKSTLVASGNISNFERSEKYIEFERGENISSSSATNISTKGKA